MALFLARAVAAHSEGIVGSELGFAKAGFVQVVKFIEYGLLCYAWIRLPVRRQAPPELSYKAGIRY